MTQYYYFRRIRAGLKDHEVLVRVPYGLGVIPEVQVIHNEESQKWGSYYTKIHYLIAKVGDFIQIESPNSPIKIHESMQINADHVGKDLVIIRKRHLLITFLAFVMIAILFVTKYVEDTNEQLSNYLLGGAVVLVFFFNYLVYISDDLVIKPVK